MSTTQAQRILPKPEWETAETVYALLSVCRLAISGMAVTVGEKGWKRSLAYSYFHTHTHAVRIYQDRIDPRDWAVFINHFRMQRGKTDQLQCCIL